MTRIAEGPAARAALLALLLSFALGLAAGAQERNRISISAGGLATGGTVSYDNSAYTTAGEGMLSRLEFPLDGRAGSVGLEYARSRAGLDDWIVSLGGSWRLRGPSRPIKDWDYEVEPGWLPVVWSYTESKASGAELGASLSVAKLLGGSSLGSIYFVVGYSYRYLKETANGYEGWQFALGPSGPPYGSARLIAETEEALRYELWSHALLAGLMVRARILPIADVEFAAAYAPGYLFDADDHLLRYKLSLAQGFFHGLRADAALVLKLPGEGGGARPFLRLDGGVEAFRSSTTVDSNQYKSYNDAFQGLTFEGMGHVVEGLRWRAGLSLGFSLGWPAGRAAR